MDDEYMNKIGEKFNALKKCFSSKINKLGFPFNEDVFVDTIISCGEQPVIKQLSDKEILGYLWVAFKNNTVRELNYSRNKTTNVIPDIIDDDCDNELFLKISNIIIDEFGEDLYNLFILHANGLKYSKIETLTDKPNIRYEFRKIRNFVREKIKSEY